MEQFTDEEELIHCDTCRDLTSPVWFDDRREWRDFKQSSMAGCTCCSFVSTVLSNCIGELAGSKEIFIQMSFGWGPGLCIMMRHKTASIVLKVEITSEKDCDSLLSVIPIRSPPPAVSNAVAAASQISNWLQLSGSICWSSPRSESSVPPPLPTRILEIRGPRDVRLYVTDPHNPERALYACLSHCWGGADFLRLTALQFLTHQAKIPWEELPLTFKDALDLTRHLGLRYLWIDSLCIVQDDPADWRHEGSKMASTYSNCYITIAASSSPNPNGGLFRQGTSYHQAQRIRFPGGDEVSQSYHIRLFPSCTPTLPLLHRAWFFQERMLSPHVAHFGFEGLEWESENCHNQEHSLSDFEVPHHSRPASVLSRDLQQKPHAHQDERTKRLVRQQWYEVVSKYTDLDLSFESDIFPALQGIAKQLSYQRRTRYHAGLWEDSLLHDLFWYCEAGRKPQWEPGVYRAPSWSWASRGGRITWVSRVHSFQGAHHTAGVDDPSLRYLGFEPQTLAEVEHVETTPDGPDEMGSIRSGVLRLKAPCTVVALSTMEQTSCLQHWDNSAASKGDAEHTLTLLQIFEPIQHVLYRGRPISSNDDMEEYHDLSAEIDARPKRIRTRHCLMLDTVRDERAGSTDALLHRRVGIALIDEFRDKKLFKRLRDGALTRTVTIV